MIKSEQPRPEPADPVEVPPRFVPVFQLVRDHRQIERQGQDLHVVLAAPELPGRESILQQ